MRAAFGGGGGLRFESRPATCADRDFSPVSPEEFSSAQAETAFVYTFLSLFIAHTVILKFKATQPAKL
jgi:hypothetical protein